VTSRRDRKNFCRTFCLRGARGASFLRLARLSGRGDTAANLGEQQEILELAASLTTRCGDAYRKANDRTGKQFNAAAFARLDVKGGRLCHEPDRPPFDGVFTVSRFECGTRVVLCCRCSNRPTARPACPATA